ncbi:hypothetical protein [Sorangium sp. So ce426]|uniref:hypothetical protein n=1 Tax=Sorangium sp. So ce426 TaxID=3133312 RepID=UPI003F5C0692
MARYGPHAILMWLSAILNSPPAQAWIGMRAATRGYGVPDIKSLPLPEFDPEIHRLIEQIMKLPPGARSSHRACWELTKSTEPSELTASFEELAGYINHRIGLSYGLTENHVSDLHSYLRETTEQWVDAPAEAHLPRPGAYRRISGSVAAIDTLRQEVSLDLYRYSPEGPLTVPLPRHIPGWALTPGVEFTCAVPAESVSAGDLRDPWLLRDFRPVPYSYMDANELERLIGYEGPEEHAHVE